MSKHWVAEEPELESSSLEWRAKDKPAIIPAKAGIQFFLPVCRSAGRPKNQNWIPAFAGMTSKESKTLMPL